MSFHAGEPPTCRMLLHWAKEKLWQAVARRWAVMSTSRVVYRRNEDSHPARRLGR